MKILAIYDNEGETLDRYTIVTDFISGPKVGSRYTYEAISASETGAGVFLWCQCYRGTHLGKKISFESLPKELQDKVKQALA
jgi:hypothetical protein